MAKKRGGHAGGHGWFVTFADLMGLLMSFFVMLVAFSSQDKQKLQIVAGSMRDAFGVQQVRFNGIIETDGLPTKPTLKNVARISPEEASNTPGPNEPERQKEGIQTKEDRAFALAAASLRQAMQELPEISELSKHVMIEENQTGLNIQLIDQDGRSMFPDGAKEPYERTRRIIQKFAGPLKALPNRVSHYRPHRGEPCAAAAGLRGLGALRRPGQFGAPNPRGRGPADVPSVHGGRKGRQPAPFPGRSAYRGQSPRYHHPHARGSAAAGRIQAITALRGTAFGGARH